jgi:hypothetical protein
MNTEPTISIQLTVNEVNFVLQVLGELPTKSGAWPLVTKIQGQAQSQVEPPAAE